MMRMQVDIARHFQQYLFVQGFGKYTQFFETKYLSWFPSLDSMHVSVVQLFWATEVCSLSVPHEFSDVSSIHAAQAQLVHLRGHSCTSHGSSIADLTRVNRLSYVFTWALHLLLP